MAGLGGLGGILGGVFGNILGAGDRQKALEQNQKALQAWLDVNVPDPEKQKIFLQNYVQTGNLDPQKITAAKQGDTSLKGVSTAANPAQLRALQQLEQEGLSGGMDLRDKAALEDANIASNTAARGRNDALVNDYAQRGEGGSGLELQARMMAGQGANQTQASNTLNAAAQSRTRALQAIEGAGSLGGQIQDQTYGRQASAAKAQDYIDQFNTNNLQRSNEYNANAANEANKYNLSLKQDVANKNTGLANTQELYNKQLLQQQFQNQAEKANALQTPYQQLGAAYRGNANATQGMWAGIGAGVDKTASSLMGAPDINTPEYLQKKKEQDAWKQGG